VVEFKEVFLTPGVFARAGGGTAAQGAGRHVALMVVSLSATIPRWAAAFGAQ